MALPRNAQVWASLREQMDDLEQKGDQLPLVLICLPGVAHPTDADLVGLNMHGTATAIFAGDSIPPHVLAVVLGRIALSLRDADEPGSRG